MVALSVWCGDIGRCDVPSLCSKERVLLADYSWFRHSDGLLWY